MNKQELIAQVAGKTKLPKTTILGVTDAIVEIIEKTLKKGEEVKLVGFGSWRKRRRKARAGRNPKTGTSLNIPAKNVAKFSMGQHLFEMLN